MGDLKVINTNEENKLEAPALSTELKFFSAPSFSISEIESTDQEEEKGEQKGPQEFYAPPIRKVSGYVAPDLAYSGCDEFEPDTFHSRDSIDLESLSSEEELVEPYEGEQS